MFNGPGRTKKIAAVFRFEEGEYGFELEPTADERFLITSETLTKADGTRIVLGRNIFESALFSSGTAGETLARDAVPFQTDRGTSSEGLRRGGTMKRGGVEGYIERIVESISNCSVYHFHDTGMLAPMRRSEIIQDSKRLRSDSANIAPFLLGLRQEEQECYRNIVECIRLVMPFFDDFILEPVRKGEREAVSLAWKQKGSDYPM